MGPQISGDTVKFICICCFLIQNTFHELFPMQSVFFVCFFPSGCDKLILVASSW